MTTYITRRLIQALVVLILISLMVFFAMRTLPGDPLMIYIVEQDISHITPELEAQLRHEFGLDKSLILQYFDWMWGLFRGDMGLSIHYRESVRTLMAERIPVTLHLGLLSFIISSVLGITAGMVAALRRGGALDNIVTSFSNFGISVPHFWLGILMIYALGLYLGWLPIQGYTSPFDDFWMSTKQLIMPVFVLATWAMAFVSRQARSSLLEVVRQDYVRTAWSKGLRERTVVLRHVLKNGLIPVVTVMGVQLSHIIGGSVIIENVFNIPGVGRLMVASVFGQDFQVVQTGILIAGVAVVVVNFFVDISYGWLDPRIRYH
ncbi:MAG: peptide ABC transporter [candidate division Zixibacteria bacterium RBG_16_53_22]|nr:MAG: peptide ABC transporter [candidate division Zixibacteria bacterium RBG_16_53_22]HJX12604.1 ABC transporter permease [Dehalococcoidales bacterium]